MKPVLEALDADVRALLDAAAPGIQPPHSAKDRVSRRLATSIAGLSIAPSTPGPAPGPEAATDAQRVALHSQRVTRSAAGWSHATVVAVFLAGAAAGVAGQAYFGGAPRARNDHSADAIAAAPSTPAGAPTAPPIELEVPMPPASGASSAAEAKSSPPLGLQNHAARGGGDLDAERALLDVGRRAFAAGRTDDVLKATREHARRFPDGILVEEREALAINALVSSSRYPEARDRADRFLRRFPESLVRPAVEAALSTIP